MKKAGWLLLLLALLLTACGAETTNCTPSGMPSLPPGSYADELEKVFALTNEARSHDRLCAGICYHATAPLVRDIRLDAAAQKHAEDMAATGVLSHTTPAGASNYPEGWDPGLRISSEGYSWQRYSENIASGQRSAQEVVTAWLSSSPHCANIMNPNLKNIGLGYAADNSGLLYWVQDFAAPPQPLLTISRR